MLVPRSTDICAGRLASLSAPSAALGYGYDGSLLPWSGGVSGAVAWTYDRDFRITAERVRGSNLASFGYDADGLLMSAGATCPSPIPRNRRR